mgnify:CR=1 FL=1
MTDEAKLLLRKVCQYLLEQGSIDEGTPEAANLFEAARTLGAFEKEVTTQRREWDQYPRSQD